jgi:prophage maintenance system killer protein
LARIYFSDPAIAREYEWWCHQVGSEDPYIDRDTVGIHDVLRAHYLLADYFSELGEGLGGVGPRDLNLLHSALFRQFVGYGGRRKWTDLFDVAATAFFGLIKNHPFHDANKRTALLSVLFQLHSRGRMPTVRQKELDDLTVAVAENALSGFSGYQRFAKTDEPEVRFLSWYFRRNTRPIDRRHYLITYRELDRILHEHGCWLENPNNNRIEILRKVTQRYGLLGLKKREVAERVTIIGFPGWSTEVSRKDIQEVRRAAGLTLEDGVDSSAFFKGADSMSALIAVYRGPLRRLANK